MAALGLAVIASFMTGVLVARPVLHWSDPDEPRQPLALQPPEPQYPVPVTMVGDRPPTQAYDFVVQIQHGGRACVGTLLRPQWVLTVAHCLKVLNAGQTVVVGGTHTPGRGGEEVRIDGVELHPRYRLNYSAPRGDTSTDGAGYDLALVHLERPMSQPVIALSTETPPVGTALRGVAYQMDCSGTFDARDCENPRLRELDVRSIPPTSCLGVAPALEQCVQGVDGQSLCRGSSGAPYLVSTPAGVRLAGLESRDGDHTLPCVNSRSITTSLAPYRKWIDNTMTSSTASLVLGGTGN